MADYDKLAREIRQRHLPWDEFSYLAAPEDVLDQLQADIARALERAALEGALEYQKRIADLEGQLTEAREKHTQDAREWLHTDNARLTVIAQRDELQQQSQRYRERLAEAEGLLASTTDLLNSWARESSVVEAATEKDIKQVVDRLWSEWSSRWQRDRKRIEELEIALEMLFNLPEASHPGSCGPESGCDGCCVDRANTFQTVRAALAKEPSDVS